MNDATVAAMSAIARVSPWIVFGALVACGCKKDEPAAPAKSAGSAQGSAKPSGPPPSGPARTPGVVPKTTSALKIDGEWDEPDWSKNALREVFVQAGGDEARPHSEVRLLHDTRNFYVGLYAADENIMSTDRFDVAVGDLKFAAHANGKLEPAPEGVNAGIDRDGTLDDTKDEDEEWVLEIAIPLDKTTLKPGHRESMKAARCDTPLDGVQRCGAWSGQILIE